MDPVQKALWFVESHSQDPLTLEDIARVCKVSAYHLTRAFAATMGLSLSPHSRLWLWTNRKQIESAGGPSVNRLVSSMKRLKHRVRAKTQCHLDLSAN